MYLAARFFFLFDASLLFCSREVYSLDSTHNEIKLEVEINSGEGLHIKLIKYLVRFDTSQLTNEVAFQSHIKTQGWSRYEFWPSSILTDCKVLIVKAVKIETCNPKTGRDHKVLDVLWTRAGFTDDFKLNLNSMARYQSVKREGEEVIIFLIQVTVNNTTWYVAHRYTEFAVLKNFLMQQNPYIAEFKDVEEKFPGKAVGLSFRRSLLEQRIEGLGAFLVFFLRNSRFCRQTSVDAVCSFLVVRIYLSPFSQSFVTGVVLFYHFLGIAASRELNRSQSRVCFRYCNCWWEVGARGSWW